MPEMNYQRLVDAAQAAAARDDAASFAELEARPGRGLWEKLGDTWPAQAAKSLYNAVKLPGDVYAGRVDPASNLAVERSFDLAGLLATGAPVTAVEGALGAAGGRVARKMALPLR